MTNAIENAEQPASLRSKKRLVLKYFSWCAVIIAICIVVISFSSSKQFSNLHGAQLVFQGRDFSVSPFGLMDAYDACVMEAKSSLNGGMIRNEMLPLSTRYNEVNNTYLVVIDADVGTIQEWTTVTIYCDIDPDHKQVSYYKEIYGEQPSLLSRTLGVLGNFLD